MPDDVPNFEARRFRTAAAHYLRGRPPYPPRLINRVVECCGLTQRDRIIDLGCGPGQLAIAFAPYAAGVLAVDPEAEMLALGRDAQVAGAAAANITWLQASSGDLGPVHAPVRLVTMGRSFHWMDRPETLRQLDTIIQPGGAIALFHDRHPVLPENAPLREYEALLARYSDDDTTRQARRAPDWVPHISVLLASAFCDLEEHAVIEQRRTTTETLIDRALSMSSTSRARLGPRADDLVREIVALLQRIAPAGFVCEVVSTYALIARRPE